MVEPFGNWHWFLDGIFVNGLAVVQLGGFSELDDGAWGFCVNWAVVSVVADCGVEICGDFACCLGIGFCGLDRGYALIPRGCKSK